MRKSSATKAYIAYHEAGHFFVAWHFGITRKRGKGLSILRDSDSLGRAYHKQTVPRSIEWDSSDRNRLRVEKSVMLSLAGYVAQRRFRVKTWRNYHGRTDFTSAFDMLSRICGTPREANAYLELLKIQTEQLLEMHWPVVKALATKLLTCKEMSSQQASEFLQEEFDRKIREKIACVQRFTRE